MQKTGGTWGGRGHCSDGDDRVWDGLRSQDHWIFLYLFVVHINTHVMFFRKDVRKSGDSRSITNSVPEISGTFPH